MRSISATETPQTCATWAIVMPYFTAARRRASCARLACRLGGRVHLRDGRRTDLRFREQWFGRLARLHDPLAIIIREMHSDDTLRKLS